MASTVTLAQTIQWSKGFLSNIDTTVNNSEPALSSANLIKQTILSPPFAWRWNRSVTGFVTSVAVQDYMVGAWAASRNMPAGLFIVDTNSNIQQANIGGTSGTSMPVWNTTLNGTTTDGSVTWKNVGSLAYGSATFNFGYIENASVQDVTVTPNKWFEIQPKRCLALDSATARPRDITAQLDSGTNMVFRVMPAPDQQYPVSITIQQKATFFTSITDTWAPIPDENVFIAQWGFLALMYMYNDDPRFAFANQKFVAAILGVQDGLTEVERSIFLNNWHQITGQPFANAARMQQGFSARGV